MRRLLPLLSICLWIAVFVAAPASAQQQGVALVIGNSTYQSGARLPNAAKDADAIAKKLSEVGFQVIKENDVGNLGFKRALRRFTDALSNADVGVVFYAGHGIEVNGTNYLVPIDAKLATAADAQDEAVPLDRVVDALEDGGRPLRLRLVIVDACYDNPFVSRLSRPNRSKSQPGAVAGDLKAYKPTTNGLLIAHAAKPGQTCGAVRDGEHGPYAQALLSHLTVVGA